MKDLIDIQCLILLCFMFLNQTTLISQSKEEEIIKTYLDLSIKYNQLGKIDSSLIQYTKVLEIKEKANNKTKHDSTSIGLIYSFAANLQDFLGFKESVISSLNSSYQYFSYNSGPITKDDKFNQINVLKSLLYHMLDQNLQDSKIFKQYLVEFTSHIENFKDDRMQYNGYKQYLSSIIKIKNNGFTKLDKAIFDAERHAINSELLLNDKLKYLSLNNYLKHLKQYRDLSPERDHKAINTHLVMLLGEISYYSLFEYDFEFSENCAREALGLKMNQWWIATNLIHALYLQGKLDDAKDLYYRYRDIKHDNGKTLSTLIKDDINELVVKNICDSTYSIFLNKIDEEISIEFQISVVPIIPILCEENSTVETTCILDYNSYKWTHDETGEIKRGQTVLLDRYGIWTLTTIDKDKTETNQKIYVDNPNDLKYTEIYLRKSSFVPIKIYLESNEKRKSKPLIAFTEGATDFVNIDTVAKFVLNNFVPIKEFKGESIIITNKDLCVNSLNNFYKNFTNLDAGLFLIMNINSSNANGTLFIKAKLDFEVLPIIDSLPKYNQLFHLQEIFPEIIKINKSSFEIARVLLSNMFMGHSVGGW